jgi:hypothetical protein
VTFPLFFPLKKPFVLYPLPPDPLPAVVLLFELLDSLIFTGLSLSLSEMSVLVH